MGLLYPDGSRVKMKDAYALKVLNFGSDFIHNYGGKVVTVRHANDGNWDYKMKDGQKKYGMRH